MTPNPENPLAQKAQDLLNLIEDLPAHQRAFATELATSATQGKTLSNTQAMWVRILHHRALIPVDPPVPFSFGRCAACGCYPNVEGGPGFYSKGVCTNCAPRYQHD